MDRPRLEDLTQPHHVCVLEHVVRQGKSVRVSQVDWDAQLLVQDLARVHVLQTSQLGYNVVVRRITPQNRVFCLLLSAFEVGPTLVLPKGDQIHHGLNESPKNVRESLPLHAPVLSVLVPSDRANVLVVKLELLTQEKDARVPVSNSIKTRKSPAREEDIHLQVVVLALGSCVVSCHAS